MSATRPFRILIAEDDEDVQRLYEKLFKALPRVELRVTNDGLHAAALLRDEPFDAAILDVRLPSMNGLQVAATARASTVNQRTPLFVVTGFADRSVRERIALVPEDRQALGLSEELTLVDRYLAIEQLRLGDRLRVRRDLEGLPPDFPLPRLLLQPLVENAVRHGIQPSREGGEVILRGHYERDGIVIEIDNPCTSEPASGGHGHGLDNVRQRVAFRYGARARVTAGPKDGRFIVRLQLPEL